MDNGWDADLLRPDRAGVGSRADAIVTDPATRAAAQVRAGLAHVVKIASLATTSREMSDSLSCFTTVP